MGRVVYRTCTLCEACCGIEVHLEDGRVERIRGNALDPLSGGYICSKAMALQELQEDPDRLRHPLRRRGSDWEPLSWSEALDLAADGIGRVREAHGSGSVATYLGEPLVHNLGALLFADELVAATGPQARFSANTLDQMPRQLVCHWMYGSGFFVSVPDVDRTDHMLILGANPLVSNGGLMTAPGIRRRLQALRQRGGKLVVIDPARTATAQRADEHHFIRPGTDPLLLAALVNTIFQEDRVRLGPLGSLLDGVEAVRNAVAEFTPEIVAEATGLQAHVIRDIARAFSDAPTAVCYGRMGTSAVRFGALASWLIEVLNVLTGNLDRPGGAMFPRPAVDVMSMQPATQRGRWHSRTRGVPEFMGELPAASLADEIETPGEGQVRGLVTFAGNPVLSSPAGHRLSEALEKLEFMVSIDLYLNETSRHADLILPPVGPLERDHFDVAFQLFYVRNVARWSPAALPRSAEGRSDAEILLELARRLRKKQGGAGHLRALAHGAILRVGVDRVVKLMLDLGLRTGPYGRILPFGRDGLTFSRLRKSLHGIDLGPLAPALPERLPASNKRINLAPAELLADFERLRGDLSTPPHDLLLIGRREPRTVNSWSHNLASLVRGRSRCVLHLHPDDAGPRGIESRSRVRVASRVGSIEVPVAVTDAVMPGVVSLPHGYGHDRDGTRMKLAAENAGASINDLTDPAEIDPLSGNAVLNGVPVSLEPARAPGPEGE